MNRPRHGKRERARERRRIRTEARAAKRREPRTSQARADAPVVGSGAPSVDGSLQWFMLKTEPRMGDRALKALKDGGAVPIVPRVSEIVPRLGRRVIRTRQLLLRTAFVGVRDSDHLEAARALPGVAGVVSCPHEVETEGNVDGIEMRPARLDPTALQRFVGALAKSEIVQPFGVKEGDAVIVRAGPFSSFPGVVEEILPNAQVKVGVSVFGRATPIRLAIAQVDRVT